MGISLEKEFVRFASTVYDDAPTTNCNPATPDTPCSLTTMISVHSCGRAACIPASLATLRPCYPATRFQWSQGIIADNAKPRVEFIKNAFPLSKRYLY